MQTTQTRKTTRLTIRTKASPPETPEPIPVCVIVDLQANWLYVVFALFIGPLMVEAFKGAAKAIRDAGETQHQHEIDSASARQKIEQETTRKLHEQEESMRKLLKEETKELETLVRGLDYDVRQHVVSQQGALIEFKANIKDEVSTNRTDSKERFLEFKAEIKEEVAQIRQQAISKDDLKAVEEGMAKKIDDALGRIDKVTVVLGGVTKVLAAKFNVDIDVED